MLKNSMKNIENSNCFRISTLSAILWVWQNRYYLKKNQMCMPGRTVEMKLLCNFSKIAKICNIFPNKGTLLNHLSSTRSYECNSFTDSHYTLVSPPSFSLRYSKPVQKTTPVYMNKNCLGWWTAIARNANQWTNLFHSQRN